MLTSSQAALGGLRILAFVMAGGQGDRLQPLTKYRAKPAVPFRRHMQPIRSVLYAATGCLHGGTGLRIRRLLVKEDNEQATGVDGRRRRRLS